jgi:hypothetical protein
VEPILRLLNLQLQRWRWLERFYIGEKMIFILKTRRAISCAVNFYNAGVVTQSRRIGATIASYNASAVKIYNATSNHFVLKTKENICLYLL